MAEIVEEDPPLPDEEVSNHHALCNDSYLLSMIIEQTFSTDDIINNAQARNRLIERIAIFIRDRITVADALIVQNGLQKIQNGDVILTYARSSIVQSLLLEVHKKGVDFRVIIVDSRPMFEGVFRLDLLLLLLISSSDLGCASPSSPLLRARLRPQASIFSSASSPPASPARMFCFLRLSRSCPR